MNEFGRIKRWILTSALVAGTVLGGAGVAAAATDGSSSTTSSTSTAATAPAPVQAQDPSTLTNGPGETVLTGTEADSVTAAAKAVIPDGTIIRVETDNEGSAYEAHVKKADGTIVTLKIDSSFTVTSTIDGFGTPPAGAPAGAHAGAPVGAPAASGAASGASA
jgi:hypothetical protein